MIRFALQCPEGHRFDSWFRDGGAFENLCASSRVVCPDCGSTEITKRLMTPQVRPARNGGTVPPDASPHAPPHASGPGPETTPLAPANERESALAALRRKVEAEADYVGLEFAREARAMHDGETPERPIYGEAKAAEAVKLIEDGIPVAPLPFAPTRKVN